MKHKRRSGTRAKMVSWGLVSSIPLTGCYSGLGHDDAPQESAAGSSGDEEGGTGDEGAEGGGVEAEQAATAGLRRLTVAEYENTLRDLLGADVPIAAIEADVVQAGFTNVGAANVAVSELGVEQFEAAAREAAEWVFADGGRAEAFVGCSPTDLGDPCVEAFIRTFGRRAWRRPLDEDDVSRYLAAGETATEHLEADVWAGLQAMTSGLLQSPFFVYRVETGEPDPDDPTRLRFDAYEMATRLSYFLWDTTPDDELLDAAQDGATLSEEGLRMQAERLLASPRAKQSLRRFAREYLALQYLDGLAKNPEVFPLAGPELGRSMREQIERTFLAIAMEEVEDGDITALLTTRETFINGKLAQLYGLPAPAEPGFAPATLPADGPRAGILTFAGFLAAQASETQTSPTRRGRFIVEHLLCQSVPPPPPDVDDVLPTESEAGGTTRDRLAQHREDPACAGCHALTDLMGLAFEHFDAIGAYRETENGLQIDVTGELAGQAFDGPLELSNILRDDPRLGACMVRQVYRYATAHTETAGEKPLLEALTADFEESGFTLRELMLRVVTSDGFRFSGKSE